VAGAAVGGCCSSVSPANPVARIPLQRETETRRTLVHSVSVVSAAAAIPLSRENRGGSGGGGGGGGGGAQETAGK